MLPYPPPADLPNPGIEPASLISPALQAASSPLNLQGSPYVTKGLKERDSFLPLALEVADHGFGVEASGWNDLRRAG